MKLVDILAREMEEWPLPFLDVGQATSGQLHLPGKGPHVGHTTKVFTLASDWATAIVTRKDWDDARAKLLVAHAQKEWNGDGLPPVGASVEYKGFKDQWKQGSYVGQFRGQIVIGCHESGVVGICESAKIRPIRTPEQIAAEKRAAAIKEMLDEVVGESPSKDSIAICEMLYDAGYRKPEGGAQ